MEWIALALVVALVLGLALFVLRKKKSEPALPESKVEKALPVVSEEPEAVPASILEPALTPSSFEEGLSKTRGTLGSALAKFFGKAGKAESVEWENIEEALLAADVGIATTTKLLDQVRKDMKAPTGVDGDLKRRFLAATLGLLKGPVHGEPDLSQAPKPYVISIVGINGAGKTTTIGKLAQHFQSKGFKVLLSAADTFRAGAINQLKTWSDRAGTDFVTGREGADPGAVVFDSLSAAKSRGQDVVLVDTAGRLHTKSGLMDELKKIHKVMKKVIPEAPHETWLVIDGTLGQNSIQQAREFLDTLPLTGVVVTKLDGTAKGGAVLAISSELKLPVRYIGLGESAKDLVAFQPEPFVDAIFGA